MEFANISYIQLINILIKLGRNYNPKKESKMQIGLPKRIFLYVSVFAHILGLHINNKGLPKQNIYI